MVSAAASLAAKQEEFMAHVLDDERALPDAWTDRHAAGMDIYRNAYRARLVDALRETYERTAQWVGEDAFRKAAAHHVITYPPDSWTLDDVGDGFVETLEQLFAGDPEVAELGWLEWVMHECFVAKDAKPMDTAGFGQATATFQEDDWANLKLDFLPGTAQREVAHDIGKLWRSLGSDEPEQIDYAIAQPISCVVWREGVKPVFMQVDQTEGTALSMMRNGSTYGEVCEELIEILGEDEAIAQAGAMLGRWLHNGLIAGVLTNAA